MVEDLPKKVNLYMGIDVSKETLDICLHDRFFKIKNTSEDICAFINAQISSEKPSLIALEATGGYERRVLEHLHQAGLSVHRAHPNRVYAFAKACHHFAKTDKLDALLLCKYAQFISQTQGVQGEKEQDPSVHKLQEWHRLSRTLEESLHAAQCRLAQYEADCTVFLQEEIHFYQQMLIKVTQKMGDLIDQDSCLSQKSEILQTRPGVGPKASMKFLAELPELGTLSKKEIAALVGVAPKTYESGKKIGVGHISGGRFYARKTLYMCALVASRFCPLLSKMYQDLQARGKAKKVALVALMRKIVVCLNAMLRDMKKFSLPS